jgi:hypothetical protein
MMTAILWLKANYDLILEGYGLIVAVGTFIVKCTPSVKDDTVWGKIVSFLDNFSTAFTKSDKLLLMKGAEKIAKEAKK